jgi:hypothetical protein
MKESIVISIYCIVEHEGRILLTHDVNKPGLKISEGKVEAGELLFDADLIEVLE